VLGGLYEDTSSDILWDQTENRNEGAAGNAREGVRRSLRSVFRRRKRVEDEEMGVMRRG
jgi:hypothetical protein